MRYVLALLLAGCGAGALPLDDHDASSDAPTVDADAPCGHQGEECCDPNGNPAADRSRLLIDGGTHPACVDGLACMVAVGTVCAPY